MFNFFLCNKKMSNFLKLKEAKYIGDGNITIPKFK